jgi:hypothetical protein
MRSHRQRVVRASLFGAPQILWIMYQVLHGTETVGVKFGANFLARQERRRVWYYYNIILFVVHYLIDLDYC